MEIGLYFVVFLASIVAGFINTLAGSGSLVMLPLLIAAGLPPVVANGTNRIAVLMQSVTGLWVFLKKTSIRLERPIWVILPSVVGALVGAYIATQISNEDFRGFLSVFMVVMLVLLLLKPEKWLKEKASKHLTETKWYNQLSLFLVGVYGGFIQAGVGIFLLAVLVMGLEKPLKIANAYKLIIIALYAFPVFIIFWWQGQAEWKWGVWSALGQMLGAYSAAHFAVKHPRANQWTYYLLILVVIVSIIGFYKGWL